MNFLRCLGKQNQRVLSLTMRSGKLLLQDGRKFLKYAIA